MDWVKAVTEQMGSTSMALLPVWLRVGWAIALVGVVAAHLWHAAKMPGQHRWWHIGHTMMSAGMIVMYLAPAMSLSVAARVSLVVFVVMSAALAATTLLWWRREGVLNPLWVASVVNMLAMVYMSLPATTRLTPITRVLVLYLVVDALAWALPVWGRLPLYRSAAARPAAAKAAVTTGLARTMTISPAQHARTPQVGLSANTTLDVRISLAIMATAMAYMLAIM